MANIVTAQLPPLVAMARHRRQLETLLVPLPRGAAARLSSATGIPRAGLVGIAQDAPESRPLLHFLAETVPPVKVPFVEEGLRKGYEQMKTGFHEKTRYHEE